MSVYICICINYTYSYNGVKIRYIHIAYYILYEEGLNQLCRQYRNDGSVVEGRKIKDIYNNNRLPI